MRTRLVGVVPVLVVVGLLAYETDAPELPGALAFVALFAAIVGGRLAADRATQRLVSVVVAILAVAITRALDLPVAGVRLQPVWIGVAVAAVLVAAVRTLVRAPEWGTRGTLALASIGLLACGEARVGRPYPVAVAVFLAAALWLLRLEDPARPPLHALSRRTWVVGAAVVGGGIGLLWAVTAPLRPVAAWMEARASAAYGERYASRGAGFADRMTVGRLRALLRSDTVVLRLYGPRVKLVRGVVFDHYESGHFAHAETIAGAPTATKKGPLEGSDVVAVTRGGRETDRFFLPLGAPEIATTGGQANVEPFGVVRASSPAGTKRYWFRVPDEASAVGLPPPTPHDVELPAELRPALRALATEWSEGETEPGAVLARIEKHLRTEYAYAIDRDHLRGRDPVMHFLLVERSGHCEYFAAAMVLVARAAGISARFVTGYRVSEKNPLDGHHVVREKNAHSWVEAFVPGRGWESFDPTPFTEATASHEQDEGFAAACVDMLAVAWDRVEAWLGERTLGELVIAASLGTALFAFVRWRRARRAKVPIRSDAFGPLGPPLPYAAALFDALAKRGQVRDAAEPIERFAARVEDSETAALLKRYAAHRYGGAEDGELEGAMRTRAATLG